MDILKETGTIPDALPSPQVWPVKHQLSSEADWDRLREFDVVLGTPNVLSPAHRGVAKPPAGLFDAMLVDEAHHSAAETWAALLETFPNVPRALLTATPFRLDKRNLPGALIYNYPLAQAIEDGVYAPISFVPVDVDDPGEADEALAAKAIERLNSPQHAAARSAILVRTDRLDDADRLAEIYRSLGVRLGVVKGTDSLKTVLATLQRLEAGEVRGLVSVSVLGEGFNLPRLKIAVYHRKHQSLPATLQFIGRVSRVDPQHPVQPELIAVRAAVQGQTGLLYREEGSWKDLIPQLSEAAIEDEHRRRVYLSEFRDPIPEDVSLHALAPGFEARIYRVGERPINLDIHPQSLASNRVVVRNLDLSGELLVLITERIARPNWIRSRALDAPDFGLHLAVMSEEGWLFVSSDTDATLDDLLSLLGLQDHEPAPPEALNRLLYGVNLSGYSSIGMRSAWAAGGRVAKYQSIAGPTGVEGAVDPAAPRMYGVGHLIGRYVDEHGAGHIIGVSIGKAKVWEVAFGSLLEYKNWCQGMAAVMSRTDAIAGTAPLLSLMMPERLVKFPPLPLAAILDESLSEAGIQVRMRSGRLVDLAAIEIVPTLESPEVCRLSLRHQGEEIVLRLEPSGQLSSAEGGPLAYFLNDKQTGVRLVTLLTGAPLSIYYADGSVSLVHTLFRPPKDVGQLPEGMLRSWSWAGTDIEKEEPLSAVPNLSVHERTLAELELAYPDSSVITDHHSGEMADFIMITAGASFVTVALLHCKSSAERKPGARVEDFYEVAGQAVRSIRWIGGADFWSELGRRLQDRDSCEVVTGVAPDVAAQVAAWTLEPPITRFQVWIVQPGADVDRITASANCRALLLNCDSWLGKHGMDLVVIGSQSEGAGAP
jgi:hypothetical protein